MWSHGTFDYQAMIWGWHSYWTWEGMWSHGTFDYTTITLFNVVSSVWNCSIICECHPVSNWCDTLGNCAMPLPIETGLWNSIEAGLINNIHYWKFWRLMVTNSKAVCTRHTLNPSSKKYIMSWSSIFSPLHSIFPHSFILYRHLLY